jgi:hypothetical protein
MQSSPRLGRDQVMRTFGQVLWVAWVAGSMAWVVNATFGSLLYGLWLARQLRRDPVRWMQRQGVTVAPSDPVEVLWTTGGLGHAIDLKFCGTAVIVSPEIIVVKNTIPAVVRRKVASFTDATELRLVGTRVVDRRRSMSLRSDPETALPDALERAGWHLVQKKF